MRFERRVDVGGPVGRVGRARVQDRVVDTLAGVFDVEDLVSERPQSEQIHQRAPGHTPKGIPGDDARKQDLHRCFAASMSSSTVSGSSSDLPTDSRAHIRRYSSLVVEQLVVTALRHDAAAVEHQDAVGIPHGRRADAQ